MYFSFVPEFFKLVVIHSCCIVCIVDGLLLSLSCIVFSMLVDRIDCDYSSHRICERFAICSCVSLYYVACGLSTSCAESWSSFFIVVLSRRCLFLTLVRFVTLMLRRLYKTYISCLSRRIDFLHSSPSYRSCEVFQRVQLRAVVFSPCACVCSVCMCNRGMFVVCFQWTRSCAVHTFLFAKSFLSPSPRRCPNTLNLCP